MKRLFAALAASAILVVIVTAIATAHDVALKSDVTEVSARMDVLESKMGAHSKAVDALFTGLDELKARLDSNMVGLDQSAAVDDLYKIVDNLRKALAPAADQGGASPPPN